MKIENPASVWRLKVELLGVAPTVWRRFDTYADVKLSQLHYFIQGAMGWELAHLFWRRLAAPGDDREDDGQADGRLPAHGRWQVRRPPEDCGGPWGYADMLRVLAGNRNARRREPVECLSRPFDPKAFDTDETRERLAEYAKVSMSKIQAVG